MVTGFVKSCNTPNREKDPTNFSQHIPGPEGSRPYTGVGLYDSGRSGNCELKLQGKVRTFPTGATRDGEQDKLDYEGFLSPLVLYEYAKYMNKHRTQSDGNLRASDNWQKGIPLNAYIKSAWRHFMDWWTFHRDGIDSDFPPNDMQIEALCGVIFNAMGYLHELLKEEQQ